MTFKKKMMKTVSFV